jgi:hypothetical protein
MLHITVKKNRIILEIFVAIEPFFNFDYSSCSKNYHTHVK